MLRRTQQTIRDYQGPFVRKEYNEIAQLDIITFQNLHTTIQVRGRTFPIVLRVIGNISCPLILGTNFRHTPGNSKMGKFR